MDNADFNIPKMWGVPLSRSDSLLDRMSSTSSSESLLNFHRQAPISPHRCSFCLMKSDLSQFEEKFKLREQIIIGCDTITELTEKIPFLNQILVYSEYIRDKTIQSKPQNICIRWGTTEEELITEYIKTFIKISDAWLSVRNCFGQDGHCLSKICCLGESDLSTNYVDWMHSSRRLLQSITQGLEKVNGNCKKNVQPDPQIGGLWGYPPNPPCQCPLKSDPKLKAPGPEPPTWDNLASPLYPSPPFGFTNIESTAGRDDYMTPSSYEVPRNRLTPSKRNVNLAKAKSEIYKDLPVIKAYMVKLQKSSIKYDSKLPQKSTSEASFEKRKDFIDSKSDSDGHFIKKDCQKKPTRLWPRRRRGTDQQESIVDNIRDLGNFNSNRVDNEEKILSGR